MGKKSSNASTRTIYGTTTTTNPYVKSTTNNGGTVSEFIKGTAFDTINNFVNSNMGSLLEQYLNPTLNSVTNQAKLNSFRNTLNNETAAALENNIINPLSNRNMVRSSQATNMYNTLARNNADRVGQYANELIANSQKDMASLLTNLMLLYMNGYSAIADNQKQSLATSQGNSIKTQSSGNTDSGSYINDMYKLAAQIAIRSAGL